MQTNDFLIHFDPTVEELAVAYWQFKALGALSNTDWAVDVWDWLEAWQYAELRPVLIEHKGVFPAIIWFTDYEPEHKRAAIHFIAHAKYKPRETLTVCREAVYMIKHSSNELCDIWAFFAKENRKAFRMALAFSDLVRWEAI